MMELGIADPIWHDKRAAIAPTVDSLGAEFKPTTYIQKVYSDGAVADGHAIDQEPLVLNDED